MATQWACCVGNHVYSTTRLPVGRAHSRHAPDMGLNPSPPGTSVTLRHEFKKSDEGVCEGVGRRVVGWGWGGQNSWIDVMSGKDDNTPAFLCLEAALYSTGKNIYSDKRCSEAQLLSTELHWKLTPFRV